MGNLHAVAASAVAVVSATETVIATMTAFNENEAAGAGGLSLGVGGVGPQGVYLGGSINVTATGTGTTLYTVRVRQDSLTGATVGVAQTVTAVSAAGQVTLMDIGELDPTLVQTPATYVVTLLTNSGAATVNRVVFTAETANSFE
jgi:hypothetical protein